MIPITQLNGSACLPKKIEIHPLSMSYRGGKNTQISMHLHNEAVSLLEQVNICVDEEELANSIIKWLGYETNFSRKNSKEISKTITQSIKQWAYLEVKK